LDVIVCGNIEAVTWLQGYFKKLELFSKWEVVVVDLKEINWGHFWRQFFENTSVDIFSKYGGG
jgi:hypothetical protein